MNQPSPSSASELGAQDASPRVSVGMPVYNGERWLRAAVGSILAQQYRDLELIISDNASTDATEAICQELLAADPRVRYYRNAQNLGVDGNYNRLVGLARGLYFKWAASNDLCAPRFISECVAVLERRPDVVLCYPRTQLIVDDKGTREDYVDGLNIEEPSPCRRFMRYLNEVRLNNVLNGVMRTEALRQTGLLRYHRGSDYVLVAELALRGKFVEVPEFLFFRRLTPESATKLKSESEVNKYYAPGSGAAQQFLAWKLAGSFLSAISRAPVGLSERICLCRHVTRRLWWMRAELGRELYAWCRTLGANARQPERGT